MISFDLHENPVSMGRAGVISPFVQRRSVSLRTVTWLAQRHRVSGNIQIRN